MKSIWLRNSQKELSTSHSDMKKVKSGSGIFRYANNSDKVLLLLGVLGSIGDGLMTPLTMIVLSDTINEFGSGNSIISNKVIDEVST